MEVLRLIENGKRCDWCCEKPGMGKPFDASRWPSIVATLDNRLAELVANQRADFVTRTCQACHCGFSVHSGSHATTCSDECRKQAQSEQGQDRWRRGVYTDSAA
jgi:hypothetical protein